MTSCHGFVENAAPTNPATDKVTPAAIRFFFCRGYRETIGVIITAERYMIPVDKDPTRASRDDGLSLKVCVV